MRLVLILLLVTAALFAKERIVTLSPAISEIIFGLGRGEEVVGVSRYASWPEAVRKLPKVGGYFNPSLEQILALRPTLVVGHAQHGRLLEQLEGFGIPVIRLELSRIGQIERSITLLGKALGCRERAAELTAAIEKAKGSAPKLKHPQKVLVVFGLRRDLTKNIYVAGHDLYFEEILQVCGAENAYSDPYGAQPVLNIEGLIATNPDQVIIFYSPGTDGDVDREAVLRMWHALPIAAAKHREVHIMRKDYLNIPSHRVAQSITAICTELNR
jgi:iron complex transport system substrate-binding protein